VNTVFQLADGLEGTENLRFQGPYEIQIADHFGWSGVPRELYYKPLQVQKVLNPIYYTLVQTTSVVKNESTGSFDNLMITKFSKNNIFRTDSPFLINDLMRTACS